jgi:hypothetical protein
MASRYERNENLNIIIFNLKDDGMQGKNRADCFFTKCILIEIKWCLN